MPRLIKVKDQKDMAAKAAGLTVEKLNQAINESGRAVFCLAGGQTPLLAYELLVQEYKESVDWSKVFFILGDERVNLKSSSETNQAGIIHYLNKLAIDQTKLLLPKWQLTVEEAAEEYMNELKQLIDRDGLLKIDVIW